jgi:hypothetical protein
MLVSFQIINSHQVFTVICVMLVSFQFINSFPFSTVICVMLTSLQFINSNQSIYGILSDACFPPVHKFTSVRKTDVNLWTEMRQASHRIRLKSWCEFMNWHEATIIQNIIKTLIWIYELELDNHHTDYLKRLMWIYELEGNKHHSVYRKALFQFTNSRYSVWCFPYSSSYVHVFCVMLALFHFRRSQYYVCYF